MNINNFCNELKNKYPNTKEVLEQIEEIRDTLNMKLEEYQIEGSPYDEGSRKAIESLGDIDSLFEELTTDVKTIYNGRAMITANIISAIIVFSIATILSILSEFLPFLYNFKPTIKSGYGMLIFAFVIVFFMEFRYILNINKVSIIKISVKEKRQTIMTSILVPAVYSIFMIILNFYQTSFKTIYFPWPIIGISNWTFAVAIYYKLIKSGKFDAK